MCGSNAVVGVRVRVRVRVRIRIKVRVRVRIRVRARVRVRVRVSVRVKVRVRVSLAMAAAMLPVGNQPLQVFPPLWEKPRHKGQYQHRGYAVYSISATLGEASARQS